MPDNKIAKPENEYLWFDERTTDEKISEELTKNAKTVKTLHIQSTSFLKGGALETFDLPNLTELLVSTAVVDWNYREFLESEAQEKFFKHTRYSILQSNSDLEGRSPSGWIRPLKRMPN